MRRESFGESMCRTILESILKRSFPKSKPDWLVNPQTGRKLELDGYNEELKLAFEFDGTQHYQKSTGYMGTKYDQIQYRDKIKNQLCYNNDVFIIRVKYSEYKNKNIEKYIADKLRSLNISF